MKKSSSIGKPHAGLREIIRHMSVGESVSYVRSFEPGTTQEQAKVTRLLSAIVAQVGAGRFEYESFTALTSRQLPVVGVVATRVS